jgi:hypothetical protein
MTAEAEGSWSFEGTLDGLTDVQRAFIAASLDAFELTLPEGESVIIEDLDDDAFQWLVQKADALGEPTIEQAEQAGGAVASSLYLARTGDRRLPYTERTLLRVRGLQAVLDDGPCPECHRLDAHEGVCAGPPRG